MRTREVVGPSGWPSPAKVPGHCSVCCRRNRTAGAHPTHQASHCPICGFLGQSRAWLLGGKEGTWDGQHAHDAGHWGQGSVQMTQGHLWPAFTLLSRPDTVSGGQILPYEAQQRLLKETESWEQGRRVCGLCWAVCMLI